MKYERRYRKGGKKDIVTFESVITVTPSVLSHIMYFCFLQLLSLSSTILHAPFIYNSLLFCLSILIVSCRNAGSQTSVMDFNDSLIRSSWSSSHFYYIMMWIMGEKCASTTCPLFALNFFRRQCGEKFSLWKPTPSREVK